MFWKVVKNIAALVGGVWVLLQLYNYLFLNVYDLQAYADTSQFKIPSKFKKQIEELNRYPFFKANDTVNFYRSSNNDISLLNYLTVITISNEGDKEIKNIQILTNGQNTLYEFFNSEGIGMSGESHKRIPLSNLLSNEKIEVKVWHEYNSPEEFSISFPEGSFEIEYSKKLYGKIASFVSFINADFWFFLFIIFLLASSLISTFKNFKSNDDVDVLNSDESEPVKSS